MAATRMTEGNILKHLIGYSIPLILGNMFQLTYNAVDSIIVGRFIGKEALAAVGTVSPVMNIIILGISGICIGASVLMSGYFGAGKEDLLKKEMATTIMFGVYSSIVIIIAGVLCSRMLLVSLQVPAEILKMSEVYLKIIFLGAPFTFFYNAVSSALKSVGDSKTPLKFLMFASILNGVLDCIFIGVFKFGIVCSAVTTVIAEAAAAILCIMYVYRKIPILQLKKGEFKIEPEMLAKTLKYGSITALQQACQPVGKLLIQGAVNPMGIDVIATFNAINRVDDYAFTPEQSISHGITTFVAQNRGADKHQRILKGFKSGLLLEFCYWVFICLLITTLKTPIMKLFVTGKNTQVIQLGSNYLAIMAIFYIFPAFTNGLQGFFRGMGNMSITLIGTVIQTLLRVVLVYVLTPRLGLLGIAYACAIGWGVMLIVEIPYYFYFMRNK